MELALILINQAEYVTNSGFTVKTNSAYSTVAIDHELDKEDGIFLQGEEADLFIEEAIKLWQEVCTLGIDTCELSLAKPYIDALC